MGLRISAKLAVNCPKDISLVDIASAATSRNERTKTALKAVFPLESKEQRAHAWNVDISEYRFQKVYRLYFHRVTEFGKHGFRAFNHQTSGKYTLACLLNNHTRCSTSITTNCFCTRCNTIWFKPRTRSNARRCFSADSVWHLSDTMHYTTPAWQPHTTHQSTWWQNQSHALACGIF